MSAEITGRIETLHTRKRAIGHELRSFGDELIAIDEELSMLQHRQHRERFRLIAGGATGPRDEATEGKVVSLQEISAPEVARTPTDRPAAIGQIIEQMIDPKAVKGDPIFDLLKKRDSLLLDAAQADQRMINGQRGPECERLSGEFEAAEERWHEFEHAIAETPAASLAGVLGKLAISGEYYRDIGAQDRRANLNGPEHLALSAFDDLRRLLTASDGGAS